MFQLEYQKQFEYQSKTITRNVIRLQLSSQSYKSNVCMNIEQSILKMSLLYLKLQSEHIHYHTAPTSTE